MATASCSKASGSSAYDVKLPAQGIIRPLSIHLPPFLPSDESSSSQTVLAYLGIPFALPPVGNLRFKPPQGPPPSWQDIRPSRWGNDPIQDLAGLGALWRAREGHVLDEGCLYLNVWVPKKEIKEGEKRPVLVWIYGGGFRGGTTSQPVFDGTRVANETNSIVVSINYRVGLFGFLASRGLREEDNGPHPLPASAWKDQPKTAGNAGLWDVVAGLDWVQNNIEAFGGDKGNVTIFGESAGAIIIHYLLLSPVIPAGLFQRAVLESGTVLSTLPKTMPALQADTDELASQLGVPQDADEATKLEALRSISAEKLHQLGMALPLRRPRSEYIPNESDRLADRLSRPQDEIKMEATGGFGPAWDGFMVSRDFRELCVAGLPPMPLRNGDKGIMAGFCVDEGSMFNIIDGSSVESTRAHASKFHPSIRDEVHELYGLDNLQTYEDAFAAISSYTGDIVFQAGIVAFLDSLWQSGLVNYAERNPPAGQEATPGDVFPVCYGYMWAHRYSASLSRSLHPQNGEYAFNMLGVAHTGEIPFILGNDLSETHIRIGNSTVDKAEGEFVSVRDEDAGFTKQERDLSAHLMRKLERFIRGEKAWYSLLGRYYKRTNGRSGIDLWQLGDCSPLGSTHPAPCYDVDSYSHSTQSCLKETRFWNETIGSKSHGGGCSAEERHDFWTKDRFKNLWIQCYGDDRVEYME